MSEWDKARDRTVRASRCTAQVASDTAHRTGRLFDQCSNRTNDASGLCWRHR